MMISYLFGVLLLLVGLSSSCRLECLQDVTGVAVKVWWDSEGICGRSLEIAMT